MIRKIISASITALMIPGLAMASSCTNLEYQEMKDMSTADLVAESCEIGLAVRKTLDAGISALGRTSQPAASEIRQTNFDHCVAQSRRVDRALEAKGVAKDTARALCRLPVQERAEAILKLASPTE